jgi:hypothetical protein
MAGMPTAASPKTPKSQPVMTENEVTRQLCERRLPIAARCDLQGADRPTLLLHTFVLAHTKGEARVAVKLGACGSGSSEKLRATPPQCCAAAVSAPLSAKVPR